VGNLWLKVNFAQLNIKMSKVIVAFQELQEFLDEAGATETTKPAICDNNDCPHRRQDKGV
jgi:hypothetical protein